MQRVNERFKSAGSRSLRDVVVVAVDDKSFEELDTRWPFRRSFHAQVIRVTRAGAKVIAYDVQFTEPTRTGDDDTLIEAVRDQPPRSWRRPRPSGDREDPHPRRRARPALQPRDPVEPNDENDSDGRSRHVAFKIDGLETFPVAAARRSSAAR